MHRDSFTLISVVSGLALAGCSTPLPSHVSRAVSQRPITDDSSAVVQAKYSEPAPSADATTKPSSLSKPGDGTPDVMSLSQLNALTLERHPRLAQVGWAVKSARGRAIQAGLYPNPTVSLIGDELGDRQGTLGIITAPLVSQEIVRGNKLGLSQAVANKEVDQATLAVVAERYRLLTEVRQNYWDVVTLQRRQEVLNELVSLANQSVENADKLLRAKEASELELVQLEVDRERYRAELEATKKSLPAAYRRLAASTGVNDLPLTSVTGDLERPLPDYDLDKVKDYVLGIHPEIQTALVGIERARLALCRAEVESIPNVTVTGGYVRQNQNRSNDWTIGASLPIPLWNKNQGNIFAARANLGEAINEVTRVQNDLTSRLATSFTTYHAARARAETYKLAILPKAEKSLQLSQKAYHGGQFEYLRVLQAQRAIAEVRLEYVRSLGEMWRSASEIAGFMLEDQWPVDPALPPMNSKRKQP